MDKDTIVQVVFAVIIVLAAVAGFTGIYLEEVTGRTGVYEWLTYPQTAVAVAFIAGLIIAFVFGDSM